MSIALEMTRGVGILTFGSIIGIVLSFVTMIVVSRVLTPSSLGDATVAFSYAALFQLGTDFGISTAVIRIGRGVNDGFDRQSNIILTYAIMKLLLGATLSSLSYLISAFALVIITGQPITDLLYLSSVVVLGSVLTTMSNSIFYSLKSFGGVTTNELSRKIVILLSLLIFGTTHQAYAFVLGTALAGAIGFCLSMTYLILIVRFKRSSRSINLAAFRNIASKLLRFGLPLSVSVIAKYGYSNFPILLLVIFNSAEDIGYFGFSQTLTTAILLISANLANTLYPILSGVDVETETGLFRNVVKESNHLVLTLSIPTALVLALLGSQIITLVFSTAYLGSSLVLWGFALQAAIYPVFHNLNITILAAGYPILDGAKSIIMLAGNILLSLILIPLAGSAGAAFSISATFVLGLVAGGLLLNRVTSVYSISGRDIGLPLLLSIVIILPVLAIAELITSLPALLLVLLLCSLAYSILAVVFGAITTNNLILMHSVASKIEILKPIRPVLAIFLKMSRRARKNQIAKTT